MALGMGENGWGVINIPRLRSPGARILFVSLAECSFVPDQGFHIHHHGMPQEAPGTPTRGPKTHQSRRKTPLRRIQDAILVGLESQNEAKLGAQEPPTAALLGGPQGGLRDPIAALARALSLAKISCPTPSEILACDL